MIKMILMLSSIPYAYIIAVIEESYYLTQKHETASYFLMFFSWLIISFMAYRKGRVKDYVVGVFASVVLSYLLAWITFSADAYRGSFLPFASAQEFTLFCEILVLGLEGGIWFFFLATKCLANFVRRLR